MKNTISILIIGSLLLSACSTSKKLSTAENSTKTTSNTTPTTNPKAKTFTKPLNIDRKEFVSYAKSFLGTTYKYGGTNPKTGLDCSGFIYIVFNHYNVKAPRVSTDFTNEGATVNLSSAKQGDLILFTGSNNSSGIVGHMGIVTLTGKTLQFVHSSSGNNIGVIESKLEGYWQTHFVKVIRVLAL